MSRGRLARARHSRPAAARPRRPARLRRSRPGPARLVIAIALSLTAWQATATTYRLMSPSEIFLAADIVFLGTLSDVVTQDRDGVAWTLVTLRVDELYAGFGQMPGADPTDPVPAPPGPGTPDLEPAPETVTLAFLGGDAAGSELRVSGAPQNAQWRFDETYLVAAYEQEGLASPLVGFRQGLWRVENESLVDLDGSPLGIADDGSPVRASVGATTSQVIRALQGLLSGDLDPADEPSGAAGGAEAAAPDPVPPSETAEDGATEPAGSGPAAPEGGETEGSEPLAAAPALGAAADQADTVAAVRLDYGVDDSGGPLLLSDEVGRAAASWSQAVAGAVDLTLDRTTDSRNVLRYGTETLLGPDTLSLTTVTAGGSVTVYLSPDAGGLARTALLHELGVIMGVPEGGDGVMATALKVPLDSPSAADVAELVAVSRFEPADLTRDGTVDFYDLIALAEAYGGTGVNLAGDLDGDGVVDDADVEALRQRYQFGPPDRALPADQQ